VDEPGREYKSGPVDQPEEESVDEPAKEAVVPRAVGKDLSSTAAQQKTHRSSRWRPVTSDQ
jgi:hypothetical protein